MTKKALYPTNQNNNPMSMGPCGGGKGFSLEGDGSKPKKKIFSFSFSFSFSIYIPPSPLPFPIRFDEFPFRECFIPLVELI